MTEQQQHNILLEAQKTLQAEVVKTQGEIVFGFAIVCTKDGEPYYDLHGDWIPEDVMLEAAKGFMLGERKALAMHQGERIGTVDFVFPLTSAIAKSLDIESKQFGLLIGMRPNEEVLAKFASGEYSGFSIGCQLNREEVSNAQAQ